MKSRIVLGLVIGVLVVAPGGVSAQFGGLLKKKAGEMLKGKPVETKPEPVPPASEPAPPPTTAPSPAPGGSSAAAPARPEAPAKSTDPLDTDNLNLTANITRFVQDERPVPEGEWDRMPFFGTGTNAALKALDDTGRVAFVEKAGAAIKTLATSDAFAAAHAEAIRQKYQAVDHGLEVSSPEALMAKKDFAAFEAFGKRQAALNVVESMDGQKAEDLQRALTFELQGWTQAAAENTGEVRAKYQRYVKQGEALVALGTSDVVKLRRGYAVLRSLDIEGPDTEAALYAMAEQAKKEKEQIAWDTHNLKGVLRAQLSAFVKLTPTVDFAAQTVEKNGKVRFVNSAYEKKGPIWKACFRAGKAATSAAQQFAQGWLKEL